MEKKSKKGRSGILSFEDLQDIKAMLEEGAKYSEIMRAYEISYHTLKYYSDKGIIPRTNFKVDNNIISKINEMRKNKISYERIANEVGLSLSYIFKLKKKGLIT
jgi:DNA invertase Pin-like site-specific DNA recombinase